MPNWWNRLTGGRVNAPVERKEITPLHALLALYGNEASWTRRGFASLASEGFTRNPVVYRCVRLIAEAANRVPLKADEGGKRLSTHPLLDLLSRPNTRQSGGGEDFSWYLAHAPGAMARLGTRSPGAARSRSTTLTGRPLRAFTYSANFVWKAVVKGMPRARQ